MGPALSGPVLAYSRPEAQRPAERDSDSVVDRMLAGHGLRLERGIRPATGQAVLRLVDRLTGRPPDGVPEALAGDLASLVVECRNQRAAVRA